MHLLTWYANQIEMAYEYYHEPNAIYEEIKIARKQFMEALKDEIDFNNLSKKEAIELRFCKWSEEDPSLYLIPIWLLPILPVGTKLACINGDEIVYDGKNVDNDVRFGCLAYGVRVKLDEKGEEK
jgi:hypothetical protein